MLSPRVQDLVERCRRTQQASATYAPLIGELHRGEASPGDAEGAFQGSVLLLGVEEVGEAADAAAEADRAHSRAVRLHQGWAKRRDDVAADLYRDISGLRKDWRGLHAGGKVEQSLGLSGKTPSRRETGRIGRQSLPYKTKRPLPAGRQDDGAPSFSQTSSGFWGAMSSPSF